MSGLKEPLSPAEARKLLRAIITGGDTWAFRVTRWTRWNRTDCTEVEVRSVLRSGVVEPAEFERGFAVAPPGPHAASLRGRGVPVGGGRDCRHGLEGDVMARRGRSGPTRAANTSRPPVACLDCGGALRISREPHKYRLHPKWAITIADAEFRRCPKCGYFEVMIPKSDALHPLNHRRRGNPEAGQALRARVCLSAPRSSRCWRGSSRRRLASCTSRSPAGRMTSFPCRPTADCLLRTMIALTTEGERFPVEMLAQIEADAGPLKLVVSVDQKGSWKRAA